MTAPTGRQLAFRATLAVALCATLAVEAPPMLTAARRGFGRAATPLDDRDRGEERAVVTLLLDALAKRPPGERLALLLPRPPVSGADETHLVYRLRTKLYPRPLEVVYPKDGRWWPLDLDYRKTGAAPPFASIDDALRNIELAIAVSELAGEPPGFASVTPPGAFGFRLLGRKR